MDAVLAGVGVAAVHVLPWAMIPDSIEWGEWQTGERHEGGFYSLVTLLRKVATSIAIPLTLWLLHFTGYDGLADPKRTNMPWTISHCWTHWRRRFVEFLEGGAG